MSLKNKFTKTLFAETPIYSLVFFRIAFGLCVLWECYDHFANGVIREAYLRPKFHFKYLGFEWVTLPPPEVIPWFFCLLCALAIFVACGLFYRISVALFTIGFAYVFLWDATFYMNHFYLMILFGAMLFFMPAHRYFSLDAYFNPKIKTEKISFWSIFFIRLQFEIVLFFAGITKINYDWLMRAMPLKLWLPKVKTTEWLHYLFTQDWALFAASYGATIIHLAGVPMLLFKRTRIYIFAAYCVFHLLNHHSFSIGSFPWLAIATTTVFFDADWPKRIFKFFDKTHEVNFYESLSLLKRRLIISLITVWGITQILVPLRFLFYPGHIVWTKEGYLFSWRLKLDDYNGSMAFLIIDPLTNKEFRTMPKEYVTYMQYRKVVCDPDMTLQLAHHIHEIWVKERGTDAQIMVETRCGVNGRTPVAHINPNVDLARVKRSSHPQEWLMPFDLRQE